MLFHELAEERRVDKVKMNGNFFDAHLRMFQLVFDLLHGMLVDDGMGGASADFLDYGG